MEAEKRTRLVAIFVTGVVISVMALATTGVSRPKGPRARNPHGRVVIMLTTGIEDRREMALCLEDARAAKASGYLADVIWIARGRGVDAIMDLSERPPEIAKLARDLKSSGVRMIASGDTIAQYGLPTSSLDPKPDEIVTDAAVRIAELISEGYEVIRY